MNNQRKMSWKILGIALLCVLGIVLFGGQAWAKEGGTISKNKKTVSFTMASNQTTGYEWGYSVDKEGLLKCTRDEYIQSDTGDVPVSGVGGTHYYTFKAKKAGRVTITFQYSRPWESADSDWKEVYRIKVGKDLKIKSCKKVK